MRDVSFWDLLTAHGIEIPIIQRDYAQGRESKKSTAIRKSFVGSIFSAISENTPPIHLNFVYGKIKGLQDQKKIEENKRAIEAMLSAVEGYSNTLDLNVSYDVETTERGVDVQHHTTFVPLDGQQRLTTLFLVHWYLLKRCSLDDADALLMHLNHFSYLIRPSTKQFCGELIKQPLPELDDLGALSDALKNESWFFQFWIKDPSVKGMLNMLDEIHRQIGEWSQQPIDDAVLSLTQPSSDKPISFELLNLDDFELTDALYVKMNSRGKALTPFENFKSWLMEYVQAKRIQIEIESWETKLDTVWADLFWEHKDTQNMLIDEEFFRFFRNMMQLDFLRRNKLETSKDALDVADCAHNREQAYRLARDKGDDGEYLFMEHGEYAELKVLSESSINRIFQCLDLFCSHDNEYTAKAFKGFVTGKMELEDKARFYATYRFLQDAESADFETEFPRFQRVYENLIKNSQIDSIQILKTVLAGLDKSAFNANIYESLLDGQLTFSGFRGSQIKEERLKAALILRNSDVWSSEILEAERHGFFNGQIGFIFALCGLLQQKEDEPVETWTAEQDMLIKEQVQEVASIAYVLFGDDGFRDDGSHLLERALLTFGDFLYRSGQYRVGAKKRFWSNDQSRDNSWHRILREYTESSSGDYEKAWSVFSQLIEALRDGQTLQGLIDAYNDWDWRYAFVKFAETIDRCGRYRSFFAQNDECYLLEKHDRRSPYVELNSFLLFKWMMEEATGNIFPFATAGYSSCTGSDEQPCAYLEGFQFAKSEVRMEVRFYGWAESPWDVLLFITDGDQLNLTDLGTHLEPLGFAEIEDDDDQTANPQLRFEAKQSVKDMALTVGKIMGALAEYVGIKNEQ
ncbi:MAG: DUF262 domain-containing protein [Pontiella sp.]